MVRREPHRPLLLLVLLTLASAAGCTGGGKNDSDTDASSSSSSSSSGGDSSSSSSSGGDSSSSGGESSSSSSGGDTTGGEFPLCLDPDPAVVAGYAFDLSLWAPDYEPENQSGSIDVDAACSASKVTREGESASFVLVCSAGDLVDVAIPVSVTMPADAALPIVDGLAVKLRYLGHGIDIDTVPGDYFAIHDESGAQLLFAGFAEKYGIEGWGAILPPFTIAYVDGLCPTLCDGVPCEGLDEGVRRRGVSVGDAVDASVTVLDHRRDVLASDDGDYEVIVGAAIWEGCINCFGDYQVLLSRK